MTDTGGNNNNGHLAELARTVIEGSNLYGFLATIFREEMSAELLGHLRSPEIRDVLAEAGVEMGENFMEMPEEQLLGELGLEFTALFLGPGGHISPHESVHVEGGGGMLWGDETVAVRKYVQAAGFKYDDKFKGMPDHLCVELEFMAEVARQEGEAWKKGDRDKAANCLEFEQEFMTDHLATWVFEFCGKVMKKAQRPFYRDMAKLTSDFLKSEIDDIERRMDIATEGREQKRKRTKRKRTRKNK